MASFGSEYNCDGSNSSSDDECLSVIKTKVERVNNVKNTRNYTDSESDECRLMTDMMVTVEVEELDESHELNFDNVSLLLCLSPGDWA